MRLLVVLTLLSAGLASAFAVSAQKGRRPVGTTRGRRGPSSRPPSRPSRQPSSQTPAQPSSPLTAREEAYRANNLGVALLEQFRHREGAQEFRRALALYPRLTLARINLAVALYNVPDIAAAEREARAAAAEAPDAPQPQYILGLIARAQNRAPEAVEAFRRVLKVDPTDVGANVNLGQLYAQERKFAEAVEAFRTAVEAEPYNGTALYNLANALLRGGRREEGQRLLQRFQELRASGAATVIGQNYLEQGRYAEAVTSTGAERELVDRRTPAVAFVDVTDKSLPPFRRADAETDPLEQGGGGAVLFDYDNDGDLDLFEAAGRAQRLLRNDAGRFTDVTAQSGALAGRAGGVATGVVAGDYDNDGREDLFVLRYHASALYRNEGGGRFRDVTAAAHVPDYQYRSDSAAFVDYDHDGDLDLFIAGGADSAPLPGFDRSLREKPPAPSLLLRNNGDGTFTDQTAGARLDRKVQALAVVPTDYDNRRDVDLLVADGGGPPLLWRNMRDGTFRDVAAEVGLDKEKRPPTSVAAGDVNKDGFTDFYFGRGDSGEFALSDGRARFQLKQGPASSSRGPDDPARISNDAAQLLDYDNDGLLDLVTVVTTGEITDAHTALHVWRNTGDGWADVTDRAARTPRGEITHVRGARPGRRMMLAGDLDLDGDTDVIFGIPGGGLRYARNEGGNRNRSLRVRLAGTASNRRGVGAKVEMRAGSLRQKLETYAASPAPAPADVLFGLGRRERADAVRVLWPSGVVQSETESAAGQAVAGEGSRTANEGVRANTRGGSRAGAKGVRNATREGAQVVLLPRAATVTVTELDRKPSSCPYLYTWNGERFEFITDFMGGGELGYWEAPGERAAPDPDEYVRISGDRLKPRGGLYELRVTNELEETLFVDKLQLVAVAHPRGVEVYPNEGLGNPTAASFKLYAARGARPPLAAADEHGHDVLARVSRLDRSYPDDFTPLPVRGYAAEHTLTLTLDEAARGGRVLLLMTGWTDYAFSSDNVAASQRGWALKPPAVQVRDAQGRWQTVIEDIGIPVGRPQTVTVDLTGKFLSASREVRVVTNMRVYWDEILVDYDARDVLSEAAGGAAAAENAGGSLSKKAGDGLSKNAADAPRVELTRLEPVRAELRWRGFSAAVTPDGREPYLYDYGLVFHASPWKVMPGRYTREGDVRELLLAADDMFVVSQPGDELALSFDARALPPLPEGWTRTFLLYADGFSKEMDINSASPDAVAPLPFHGMKHYPYAPPETYPQTPAHRSYLERYNTRVVANELGSMN